MSEPKFTPGPWKHDTEGNIGNLVKGPSGAAPLYDGDNCMRAVATVQACCAFQRLEEQEENCAANIALIAAAPELYEAAKRLVAEVRANTDFPELRVAIGNTNLACLLEAAEDLTAALRKARGEA